jgi:hypothetical protein
MRNNSLIDLKKDISANHWPTVLGIEETECPLAHVTQF